MINHCDFTKALCVMIVYTEEYNNNFPLNQTYTTKECWYIENNKAGEPNVTVVFKIPPDCYMQDKIFEILTYIFGCLIGICMISMCVQLCRIYYIRRYINNSEPNTGVVSYPNPILI